LLLISDVLGDVGQSPQACPRAIGQLAKSAAKGPPMRRIASPCQKVAAPIMAKITPMRTKMTPKIPMNISTVDHSLSAP
jgi:hypothetical protein